MRADFDLIALVGPTASGKSELSLRLARSFKAIGTQVELINADAMQLYKGMDIGTAKLSTDLRAEFPHHLFDVINPNQEISAEQYQTLARDCIDQVIARGSLPVLVGGSMFYVAAALDGLDFAPTDPAVRARLELEAETLGPTSMHDRLAALDPKAAAKIAPQNVRKVIRALEVIQLSGEPFRADYPEPEFIRPTRMFGLAVDRELLRGRIAARVDQMWEQGLLAEVKALRARFEFSRTALRAIGYAQAIAQLEGELSEPDAKEQTRLLTAQYAKRQISWFRRDTRITWLDAESDPHAQLCKELGLPNEF